ncbi:ABC transporter substrate-binding protein [Sphingomonas jatrophae]|uniref:Iron complex transport system substrate-binding protein n=1 Tax=Sphingomonas jatrophae TaxID=1166337 RepID=A0A1I6JBM7_9SPHN|nr:ABC transporter substrate-binding protein [Sphingomonas jatrophae]SFR76397.1 iron complex transport system substrate-binding protein [Sphingomonas jatrophae]
MRRGSALLPACLAALALAGCSAGEPAVPSPGARPLRVMSLNQCADQLVLALLPPERIASVTWLSRDAGTSAMAAEAARVPVNHGQAEEVLAQSPDLVIAGSFTTPALRGMLRRLGYPLVEVEDAASFADIRRITRQIAEAVGEGARGEALIAGMDRDLAALARQPTQAVRVVAWDRSGFAGGAGTLQKAILDAAGARNVAPADAQRRPDMEALLAARPALLVQGSAAPAGASLGDDVTNHRLVRRLWSGRTLGLPQAAYVCGTPAIARAALGLSRSLRDRTS